MEIIAKMGAALAHNWQQTVSFDNFKEVFGVLQLQSGSFKNVESEWIYRNKTETEQQSEQSASPSKSVPNKFKEKVLLLQNNAKVYTFVFI